MTYTTPARGQIATQADLLERQLLGGMLRNGRGAVEVVGDVREEDFRSDPHRRVFRAVASLAERGEPVELVSVAQELARLGHMADLGGTPGEAFDFLAALHEDEPTGHNLPYYARLVRGQAILRRLADAGRQVVTVAEEPGKPAEDALDEAERLVFSIGEERLALVEDERHVREVVGEVYDRLDERTRNGAGCSGVPSGLASLDEITAGLQASELTILAARPSKGKTTLAMSIACSAALRGTPVLVVSLEQPRAELVERLLCSMSGVNGQAVRQGELTAEEQRRYAAAGDRLQEAPLVISDLPSQRVARIAARARRRAAQGQLGLVIIDYLQLIEPENRRDPRHEQVAQISRRLKILSRELRVPVLVLAQLNRESEHRTDRRPRLADLRESGSIEADADVVLLLHRPEDKKSDLEVIVAKNRNGPTGEVILRHNRGTGRITDPADTFPDS